MRVVQALAALFGLGALLELRDIRGAILSLGQVGTIIQVDTDQTIRVSFDDGRSVWPIPQLQWEGERSFKMLCRHYSCEPGRQHVPLRAALPKWRHSSQVLGEELHQSQCVSQSAGTGRQFGTVASTIAPRHSARACVAEP